MNIPEHQWQQAVLEFTQGLPEKMRWEDVNLDLGVWSIPHTKTGKHTVPLLTQALEILCRHAKTRGEAEFVLPGRHGKGHITDPMRQWREILVPAGMSNLRIHDLRRTLGSWQAGTGSSLPTIGKTMGHSRPETTAIYSRLDLKTVRESMQTARKWARFRSNRTGRLRAMWRDAKTSRRLKKDTTQTDPRNRCRHSQWKCGTDQTWAGWRSYHHWQCQAPVTWTYYPAHLVRRRQRGASSHTNMSRSTKVRRVDDAHTSLTSLEDFPRE